MQKSTKSAPEANTKAERLRAMIERIAAALDPEYPSTFVPDNSPSVNEPADGYMGRELPDFVKADNDNFNG